MTMKINISIEEISKWRVAEKDVLEVMDLFGVLDKVKLKRSDGNTTFKPEQSLIEYYKENNFDEEKLFDGLEINNEIEKISKQTQYNIESNSFYNKKNNSLQNSFYVKEMELVS